MSRMAEPVKVKHIKIEAKEYVQMKTDVEMLKERMNAADSDVAYQGYRRAWSMLSKAYQKAGIEIQAVEAADSRKQAREKRQTRVQKSATKGA
jgi:hypothetical protein